MIFLHDVEVINEKIKSILIDNGLVYFNDAKPKSNSSGSHHLYFDNCIAFPGLINSHDHLDFNLFPKLGNKVYEDYTEWGNDIHTINKNEIKEVLKVPRHLRTMWGIYKNLLNGVTTVVHHGNYVSVQDAPIQVYQECNMLHSIQLENNWKLKLNKVFTNKWPYVIHIGEGTNDKANNEINSLIKWNLFKRKLIGIHGVAMTAKQSGNFEALIWCPDSNLFLLGVTASINELKKNMKIVFGTDSTLSANWNTWEQLRIARKTALLTDEELFTAFTKSPADLWNIQNTGLLKEGMNADIVIARRKENLTGADAFFNLNPQDILLILKKGEIVLFDQTLLSQLSLKEKEIQFYNPIFLNNSCKYVRGSLQLLVNETRKYSPGLKLPFDVNQ